MILVTGATGNVGSQVVRELRERGEAVRAFVRDGAKAAAMLGDDVELAAGDFGEPASVRAALAGVDRVFLSSASDPRKPAYEAAVVDAAADRGVELIVKASALDAAAGSPLPGLDWNGRSEDHLRRSGIPWAMLQSAWYMTNCLLPGAFAVPAGDGRVAMIDPRDVAAVGATALVGDGHAGAVYRLTGPAAITYAEAAAQLSAATGEAVEYVDVPAAALPPALAAAGMPDWLVEHLVKAFELIRAGAFEETTGDVRAVTGRAARGFAEFARDRAGGAQLAKPVGSGASSRSSR
jgi:uncharacterized protein YbjT (DUF2867 family)